MVSRVIRLFQQAHTTDGKNTKSARKLLPSVLLSVARRKLDQLDSVTALDELKVPPGNMLEFLSGDRKGQLSIRINEVINQKRGITPSTALRLAKYFGVSEDFWLNVQLRWDLFKARRREISELKMIQHYKLSHHISTT